MTTIESLEEVNLTLQELAKAQDNMLELKATMERLWRNIEYHLSFLQEALDVTEDEMKTVHHLEQLVKFSRMRL